MNEENIIINDKSEIERLKESLAGELLTLKRLTKSLDNILSFKKTDKKLFKDSKDRMKRLEMEIDKVKRNILSIRERMNSFSEEIDIEKHLMDDRNENITESLNGIKVILTGNSILVKQILNEVERSFEIKESDSFLNRIKKVSKELNVDKVALQLKIESIVLIDGGQQYLMRFKR